MDSQALVSTAAAFGPAALIVVSVVAFLRELWPKQIDGKPRVFLACVIAAVAVVCWMQVRGGALPTWRALLVGLLADVPPVVVLAFGGASFVKRLKGGASAVDLLAEPAAPEQAPPPGA